MRCPLGISHSRWYSRWLLRLSIPLDIRRTGFFNIMLVETEDLEQLAETCLAAAKTIKQYLASNDLPQMSFDQNGPPVFPDANKEVQFARLTLMEAAQRLVDLTAGPEEIAAYSPWFRVSIWQNGSLLQVLTFVAARCQCLPICSALWCGQCCTSEFLHIVCRHCLTIRA